MESIGDLIVALRALEKAELGHDLYVGNGLRKEFLIQHNNKFISRGTVHEVNWEDVGGGVWKANI